MALELDDRQRAMLQEMGVHVWLPVQEIASTPWVAATPAVVPAVAAVAAVPRAVSVPVEPSVPPSGAMGWPELVQSAANCQACGLCAGRKHSTLKAPGVSAGADWLIVGDPPDEDEDRAGAPFVEASGELLANMLKAVGVSRTGTGSAGAYASNVVKCRPPHGRVVQAAELRACATFLEHEIALVRPKVILAMGRFAVQLLLSGQPELTALPLGKLRGTVHQYGATPVVVTYHPKVLLRTSADKAKAWADLCLAAEVCSLQ